MKTRFNFGVWVDGYGNERRIEDMETGYLINVCLMLYNKPTTVQKMLIRDIETDDYCTFKQIKQEIKRKAVAEVTGMNAEETREFVTSSELFNKIVCELCGRGVNISNVFALQKEESEVK